MWSRIFARGSISFEQVKLSLPLIFLLNNRYLAFALAVSETSDSENISKSAEKLSPDMSDNEGNGLILYADKYSFYSQKVVLALHEKKISFQYRYVNLMKREQYEKWFLEINPRGEVPVLQDTGKIIPDSSRIIDYLEDNFSNGDTPRLNPIDQGPEIRQKVSHFRNLIDTINGNVLALGAGLHPDLATGERRVPFIGPVLNQLVSGERSNPEKLRKLADKIPEAKEILLEKAEKQEKNFDFLKERKNFLKVLDEADKVFDQIEEELRQHTDEEKNWWLCSDRFTVADVCLTILLDRASRVGLEPQFWSDGKRPHLEQYYKRVQERESYKQTVPNSFDFIKTIFMAQAPLIIGVGVTTLVVIIVGGYFIVKKIINK